MLIIIPARYGSTRFPGKPLALIDGREMILHVVDGATRVKNADRVIVATDDERIAGIVRANGAEAIMTSASHENGTSRVCEVASGLDYQIIVNLQGDEPLVPVTGLEDLIGAMASDESIVMGTLASESDDREAFKSRQVVKVAASISGDALYFSRSPLPSGAGKFLRHVGVYVFRKDFLLGYGNLERGPLEKREDLEQLRALENGYNIRIIRCDEKSTGVDTPEDIKRVEKIIRKS
ncbi:MAG: 3-deoxy-manno-octulosonate cytidylyltransferase [Candidatus Krumholzibacteriota bacterium]|nr:3-deoxy-manno-octulosonate cytidylyltransferase [Candidatus Krumholzibacteriota bacterium]